MVIVGAKVADTAGVSEHVSFGEKIAYLPEETKVVLGDTGYDNNAYGEAIEYDEEGRRTGRRFLCPSNPRNRRNGSLEVKTQRIEQIHRENRLAYYRSPRGQALYARRGQTVEPFVHGQALPQLVLPRLTKIDELPVNVVGYDVRYLDEMRQARIDEPASATEH